MQLHHCPVNAGSDLTVHQSLAALFHPCQEGPIFIVEMFLEGPERRYEVVKHPQPVQYNWQLCGIITETCHFRECSRVVQVIQGLGQREIVARLADEHLQVFIMVVGVALYWTRQYWSAVDHLPGSFGPQLVGLTVDVFEPQEWHNNVLFSDPNNERWVPRHVGPSVLGGARMLQVFERYALNWSFFGCRGVWQQLIYLGGASWAWEAKVGFRR